MCSLIVLACQKGFKKSSHQWNENAGWLVSDDSSISAQSNAQSNETVSRTLLWDVATDCTQQSKQMQSIQRWYYKETAATTL